MSTGSQNKTDTVLTSVGKASESNSVQQRSDYGDSSQQLLNIIRVDNSTASNVESSVPIQFVHRTADGVLEDESGNEITLESQAIELNGGRHVILQQAENSETGEILVLLQGENGEQIALTQEALSSGLVQVSSGSVSDQVIALTVSQDSSGSPVVVVNDGGAMMQTEVSNSGNIPVTFAELASSIASIASMSIVNENPVTAGQSTLASSTTVVQSLGAPRMATHQEMSKTDKSKDSVNVNAVSSHMKNETHTGGKPFTENVEAKKQGANKVVSVISSTETQSVASLDPIGNSSKDLNNVESKPFDVSSSSSGTVNSVIFHEQTTTNANAIEALVADAVSASGDNNYVIMTTGDEGSIPAGINLADVLSADSSQGQTFFIETPEGIMACTAATTAEDGSIQIITSGTDGTTIAGIASETLPADSQILQGFSNESTVTYTLQSTPSGLELMPVVSTSGTTIPASNFVKVVTPTPKPKQIKPNKVKTPNVVTTKPGETILLSTSTTRTITTPVSVVSGNLKRQRPATSRSQKNATTVTVTTQPTNSTHIIPVQPDGGSINATKSASWKNVSSNSNSGTSSNQLTASRRTYSKKSNVLWLNPDQTTIIPHAIRSGHLTSTATVSAAHSTNPSSTTSVAVTINSSSNTASSNTSNTIATATTTTTTNTTTITSSVESSGNVTTNPTIITTPSKAPTKVSPPTSTVLSSLAPKKPDSTEPKVTAPVVSSPKLTPKPVVMTPLSVFSGTKSTLPSSGLTISKSVTNASNEPSKVTAIKAPDAKKSQQTSSKPSVTVTTVSSPTKMLNRSIVGQDKVSAQKVISKSLTTTPCTITPIVVSGLPISTSNSTTTANKPSVSSSTSSLSTSKVVLNSPEKISTRTNVPSVEKEPVKVSVVTCPNVDVSVTSKSMSNEVPSRNHKIDFEKTSSSVVMSVSIAENTTEKISSRTKVEKPGTVNEKSVASKTLPTGKELKETPARVPQINDEQVGEVKKPSLAVLSSVVRTTPLNKEKKVTQLVNEKASEPTSLNNRTEELKVTTDKATTKDSTVPTPTAASKAKEPTPTTAAPSPNKKDDQMSNVVGKESTTISCLKDKTTSDKQPKSEVTVPSGKWMTTRKVTTERRQSNDLTTQNKPSTQTKNSSAIELDVSAAASRNTTETGENKHMSKLESKGQKVVETTTITPVVSKSSAAEDEKDKKVETTETESVTTVITTNLEKETKTDSVVEESKSAKQSEKLTTSSKPVAEAAEPAKLSDKHKKPNEPAKGAQENEMQTVTANKREQRSISRSQKGDKPATENEASKKDEPSKAPPPPPPSSSETDTATSNTKTENKKQREGDDTGVIFGSKPSKKLVGTPVKVSTEQVTEASDRTKSVENAIETPSEKRGRRPRSISNTADKPVEPKEPKADSKVTTERKDDKIDQTNSKPTESTSESVDTIKQSSDSVIVEDTPQKPPPKRIGRPPKERKDNVQETESVGKIVLKLSTENQQKSKDGAEQATESSNDDSIRRSNRVQKRKTDENINILHKRKYVRHTATPEISLKGPDSLENDSEASLELTIQTPTKTDLVTQKKRVDFQLSDDTSTLDSPSEVIHRKRGRRSNSDKNSEKIDHSGKKVSQITPILRKSAVHRPYVSTPSSLSTISNYKYEKTFIVKKFGEINAETLAAEMKLSINSLSDLRSPAERYDYSMNECHFHIRHQSSNLNSFTPRGTGSSYLCQKCGFRTSRMNNLILHHKDQCPVVKNAVMLLWESEIRRQTKRPYSPSNEEATAKSSPADGMKTSATIDKDTERRTSGGKKLSTEIKDAIEADERDIDEEAEALTVKRVRAGIEASKTESLRKARASQLSDLSVVSDEDEETQAMEKRKKRFGFEEKEIVWAKIENNYWPAIVTKIVEDDHQVLLKLIDKNCFTASIDQVLPFDSAERNKKFLSDGKASYGDSIVKAVQKAEDYSRKRCLGDESGAAKLFGDMSTENRDIISDEERLDDESHVDSSGGSRSGGTSNDATLKTADSVTSSSSVLNRETANSADNQNTTEGELSIAEPFADVNETLAQWKECRRVSNAKLLQCIKDSKIENHLLGVYRETIPSNRHKKFKSGSDLEKSQLKHVSWFGPIDDEDQQEEIYDYCSQLFKSNFKTDGSFDTVAYLFEVWVPEAIVKAISRIRRIELDEAEAVFGRGVVLSQSEKYELEKEINKEAEKQTISPTRR